MTANGDLPRPWACKNWLFAGSDAGGDRAAIFHTLTRSAKLNALEPAAWLRDVLSHIGRAPDQSCG